MFDLLQKIWCHADAVKTNAAKSIRWTEIVTILGTKNVWNDSTKACAGDTTCSLQTLVFSRGPRDFSRTLC